jgi:integrase/recombinase XerD
MTKDYNSIYGEHIQQFIAMKRKLGFKFVKDAKLLRSIDVLATESGQIAPGITKEFADLWIKKSLNESSRNHYQRAICLNHFSTFLFGLGILSYIPKLPPPPKTTFIPHIYSPLEVNALFEASDKLRMPNSCMSCSLICLPLLIRTLYSTGIRIGEALALKDEDVDLVENYLRVRDSKNGKERVVPISETLAEACRNYISYRNKMPSRKLFRCFFVKLDGSKLTPATVGVWFRRCLALARIPYIGMYQGPRIHDLRHTFAVTSLANMAESGIDLYVSLPVLSTYLGHQSLESTNPNLIKDVNLICQDVFPKYKNHEAD